MLNANAYNGVVDGNLQQGAESSYAAIKFDVKTKEGACWALSVMWMAHRSTTTGTFADFLAWIKRPSGIKMMNNSQVEHAKRKDSGESSKVYLKEWLKKQFFIIDDNTDHTEVDWPTNEAGVSALTDPETYKFINLQFGSGGHAIACHSYPGGVTFFDPNYGQFTFASHANFKRWMLSELLPEYNNSFGLEWFRITNVHRGIGPAKPIA